MGSQGGLPERNNAITWMEVMQMKPIITTEEVQELEGSSDSVTADARPVSVLPWWQNGAVMFWPTDWATPAAVAEEEGAVMSHVSFPTLTATLTAASVTSSVPVIVSTPIRPVVTRVVPLVVQRPRQISSPASSTLTPAHARRTAAAPSRRQLRGRARRPPARMRRGAGRRRVYRAVRAGTAKSGPSDPGQPAPAHAPGSQVRAGGAS